MNGTKKVCLKMGAKKPKDNNRKPYVPADKGYGRNHKSGVNEFQLLMNFKRKQGLTNRDLSRLLGVSHSTIHSWTAGRNFPNKQAQHTIRLIEYLLNAETGHTVRTVMQMLF